ncbi:hypothetical protein ACI2JA_04150 [Alkalihalobacillus sp. NPDC078783]
MSNVNNVAPPLSYSIDVLELAFKIESVKNENIDLVRDNERLSNENGVLKIRNDAISEELGLLRKFVSDALQVKVVEVLRIGNELDEMNGMKKNNSDKEVE